jgi:hypothetical protein
MRGQKQDERKRRDIDTKDTGGRTKKGDFRAEIRRKIGFFQEILKKSGERTDLGLSQK